MAGGTGSISAFLISLSTQSKASRNVLRQPSPVSSPSLNDGRLLRELSGIDTPGIAARRSASSFRFRRLREWRKPHVLELKLHGSVGPDGEQEVLAEPVVVHREERSVFLALTPPDTETVFLRPFKKSPGNRHLLFASPLPQSIEERRLVPLP